MLNISEQGDRYELRIDNQPFSHLYLAERSRSSFKHEGVSEGYSGGDVQADLEQPRFDYPSQAAEDPYRPKPAYATSYQQHTKHVASKPKDPLEFDNGFGMFEYKSTKPAPSQSRPMPATSYKKSAARAMAKPQPQPETQEWQAAEQPAVEEPAPAPEPEKPGDFNWDAPAQFQFEDSGRASDPPQPAADRRPKPGIFAGKTAAATKAPRVSAPPPRRQPAPKPAPQPERKEVKKQAPPPAPVPQSQDMLDLMLDTNPTNKALPEDLFADDGQPQPQPQQQTPPRAPARRAPRPQPQPEPAPAPETEAEMPQTDQAGADEPVPAQAEPAAEVDQAEAGGFPLESAVASTPTAEPTPVLAPSPEKPLDPTAEGKSAGGVDREMASLLNINEGNSVCTTAGRKQEARCGSCTYGQGSS